MTPVQFNNIETLEISTCLLLWLLIMSTHLDIGPSWFLFVIPICWALSVEFFLSFCIYGDVDLSKSIFIHKAYATFSEGPLPSLRMKEWQMVHCRDYSDILASVLLSWVFYVE